MSEKFRPKMQNMGLRNPYWENLGAEFKIWATIEIPSEICSISKEKVNFLLCLLFSTHDTTDRQRHAKKLKQSCESINKKSELMLMRRARTYDSFCWQVIVVYLHPFHRNPLFCSQKSFKMNIFRVQGHSRSSTLTFLRSLSSVLVMISSTAVPICNHLHARQVNKG